MEFEKPNEFGFTVYSKSGCPNCIKVKTLLKEKNLVFNVVDCDEYLIEDKENFLLFIEQTAKKSCKQFPMVFNDTNFLGGFNETKEYIDKKLLSFEETFSF
jgi:glutaredoxin